MSAPVLMAAVPTTERPRERMVRIGPDALTDRELLALVLRNGVRGESVLDLANSLLAEYGGLADLAISHPDELVRRSGIGLAKATAVVAAFHLGRRAATTPLAGRVLRNAADVAAAARPALQGCRRERAVVLVCDSANRLKTTAVVSEGSIDRTLLPVREILNLALRHDGRAFALAHNHPGGEPAPSDADRQATVEVATAAHMVGLRFLGHVVVAGDSWEDVPHATSQRTSR